MMMDALEGMETPRGASIAAPEGFSAPEEVREGEAFEVVAKIRLRDGQIVFDSINGVEMSEAEPEPEVEETEEVEAEEVTETPAELTLNDAARASGY